MVFLKDTVTMGHKKGHLEGTTTRVSPSDVSQSRHVPSPENHGNNNKYSK